MASFGRLDAKLSVAIPGSFVADTPHLREKTAKLGIVARACSIFGVREIILYLDDVQHNQKENLQLCAQILGFIETPQYLRKRLFGLRPSLKFAGILPPLQIPSHDVPRSIRECKENDVREGLVIGRLGETLSVEVGLERTLECSGDIPVGTRVTVRLTKLGKNLIGEIIDPTKISISQRCRAPIYWGYKVTRKSSLGTLLRQNHYDLTIGTSRYAKAVTDAWEPLKNALSRQSVLLAFGSPKQGLQQILQTEKMNAEEVFDFLINTVPDQNTATVRTEEALLFTLSILNVMRKLP